MGRLKKAALALLALLAVMIGAFAALSAYTVIWDRRHPMTGGWRRKPRLVRLG
jgi:Spy/CpxP family protein refolding chaperone